MGKSVRIRFTFALRNAVGSTLSCSGWRVWTNAEDTYITAKSLRDTWKVSLHGDEWWAAAITREHSKRADSVLPAGHDRTMWTFEPTAFHDGRRVAFAVGVFRHALLPGPLSPRETVVDVPDRWDTLTLALVRMTEPGVKPDPGWQLIGGPLPLASGRRVWLTAQYDQIEEMEPEPQATGSMIETWSPQTHNVASPAWIVKGVHVA